MKDYSILNDKDLEAMRNTQKMLHKIYLKESQPKSPRPALYAASIIGLFFVLGIVGLVYFNEKGPGITGAVTQKNCDDSDEGIDYIHKGTVEAGFEYAEDECNGKVLIEYYCQNGYIIRQKHDCEIGCAKGACIN